MSVMCAGRKLSSGCGGHEVPARGGVLAEMGCYSSRLAEKREVVLDLSGERHLPVLDNVVMPGDGENFSRTCRAMIFC